MKNGKLAFVRTSVILAVMASGWLMMAVAGPQAGQATMTKERRFYCNTKALTPEERAHHKQISERLLAARKQSIETEKGYEFQFSPADVSLADIADWVAAESKCCPFFDFHIDLEREGRLLCLRLTGEPGIKTFIREEFSAPSK